MPLYSERRCKVFNGAHYWAATTGVCPRCLINHHLKTQFSSFQLFHLKYFPHLNGSPACCGEGEGKGGGGRRRGWGWGRKRGTGRSWAFFGPNRVCVQVHHIREWEFSPARFDPNLALSVDGRLRVIHPFLRQTSAFFLLGKPRTRSKNLSCNFSNPK